MLRLVKKSSEKNTCEMDKILISTKICNRTNLMRFAAMLSLEGRKVIC